MNILNRTILEVKIGDRFYNFECSPDSPLQEVNNALQQMNSYILERIKETQKNASSEEIKTE